MPPSHVLGTVIICHCYGIGVKLLSVISSASFYFVKDFADRFFDGTDVLPRSRAIACRLYRLVPYLPGVEERLEQCSSC